MHKLKKEIDIKDIEKKKDQLEKDYSKTNVQFLKSKGEKVEEQFKQYTVGLSTREEFKRKQENIYALIQEREDHELQKEELEKKRQIQERKMKNKKKAQILSFVGDDEDEEENNEEENENFDITSNKKQKKQKEEEEEDIFSALNKQKENKNENEIDITKINDNNNKRENPEKNNTESNTGDYLKKKIMIGKNPNVNTLYLPDMQRDHAQYLKKELLKQEYQQMKDKLENQFIDIKYSYWDGFKIVKTLRIKQKVTILDFLENCRKNLIQEYPQLMQLKAIDLIAVARDEILPNKMSFYEIIQKKLKNKKNEIIFEFEDKTEKDPLGKDITISVDDKTVIMIVEKSVTEKPGENPLYFFLKK